MSYNPQSREDILRHAKLLLGHSLRELYPERDNADNAYEGRGRLGFVWRSCTSIIALIRLLLQTFQMLVSS